MTARLTALLTAISLPADAAVIKSSFDANLVGMDGSAAVLRVGRTTIRQSSPRTIDITGAFNAILLRAVRDDASWTMAKLHASFDYVAPEGRDARTNLTVIKGEGWTLQRAYDYWCGLKK